MTCSDIKDRLVDYLYAELAPGDRQAFEAHLSGCPACRGEVDALGSTLARTRAVVRTSLEEPPPRVHAAVLAQAAAHATAGVTVGRMAPPLESAGWLGRLLGWVRRPWILPAFAAASVMAVFVLARKVVVDPERKLVATPELVQEPAPAAPPALSAPAEPAADHLAREEAGGAAPARRALPTRKRASGPRATAFAPPPQGWQQQKPRQEERAADEGDDRAREATRRLDEARQPTMEVAPSVGGGAALGRGVADNETKRGWRDAEGTSRPKADLKPAPTRPESPRPMRAAAPAPPPPAEAPVAPPSASAAAARPQVAEPEPPAGRPKAKKATAPADRPAAPFASSSGSGSGSTVSFADLLRRADRAFADRRWGEAAAAYRDLLRRYPDHRSAPSWKTRLSACDQALRR
jgi:hypothetical protein